MERRTKVLEKSLNLSEKLAEFIIQHYCPKTMKSGISDTFYRILASVMDVVVDGLGTVQALSRHKVLDVVKESIVGEPGKSEAEKRAYEMYIPSLGDIVAVLNLYYHSYVSTCLSEEFKLKHGAEKEKVEKKIEEKPKKKAKKG
jgi:hypothetical protein